MSDYMPERDKRVRNVGDMSLSVGYGGLTNGGAAGNTFSALQPATHGPNAAINLNLNFPVSDAAYQSVLQQRIAAAEQNLTKLRALQNNVRSNVHVQANNLRLAANQYQVAKNQAEIQAQVLENEKKRVKMGAGSILDVIYNNSQLALSQQNVVMAQRNFAQALIAFRFATGLLLDTMAEQQQLQLSDLTTLPSLASKGN